MARRPRDRAVMIAAATFGIIAYLAGNAIFSTYLGINFVPVGELAVVCGALIGAAWLSLVQRAAAQIFMGDTGSLALGGRLAPSLSRQT